VSSTILSLIAGALLAATLSVARWSDSRPPDVLARPLETLPADLGGWQMVSSSKIEESVLAKLIPTAYIVRNYRKGTDQVELFIAYYASMRAGESMHSPKNCLPGAGWEIWDYGTAGVRFVNNGVDVNKFFIQNGRARETVLYWYQTRDRIVADEYGAKAFFIWDKLTKGHSGGSIVRITSDDRPNAVENEVDFAKMVIPQVDSILGDHCLNCTR